MSLRLPALALASTWCSTFYLSTTPEAGSSNDPASGFSIFNRDSEIVIAIAFPTNRSIVSTGGIAPQSIAPENTPTLVVIVIVPTSQEIPTNVCSEVTTAVPPGNRSIFPIVVVASPATVATIDETGVPTATLSIGKDSSQPAKASTPRSPTPRTEPRVPKPYHPSHALAH